MGLEMSGPKLNLTETEEDTRREIRYIINSYDKKIIHQSKKLNKIYKKYEDKIKSLKSNYNKKNKKRINEKIKKKNKIYLSEKNKINNKIKNIKNDCMKNLYDYIKPIIDTTSLKAIPFYMPKLVYLSILKARKLRENYNENNYDNFKNIYIESDHLFLPLDEKIEREHFKTILEWEGIVDLKYKKVMSENGKKIIKLQITSYSLKSNDNSHDDNSYSDNSYSDDSSDDDSYDNSYSDNSSDSY